MNPEEYVQLFRLGGSHWWFVGTRDILFSSVKQKAGRAGRILDAGCGSGLMMRRFSECGPVFGFDRNMNALNHCAGLGFHSLCRGNVVLLPYKANTFDLIIAADLLEHCEDDEKVLREFNRVTAPGGSALISVPAYNSLWSSHDESLHHKRRYSKADITGKMLRAGYVIDRATYFNTILFPPVALARLTLGKLPRQNSTINYHENMKLLNEMLLGVMRLERRLLQRIDFPFGLSVLVIASKAPAGT
jgi:SAM-dependent methyltransferase